MIGETSRPEKLGTTRRIGLSTGSVKAVEHAPHRADELVARLTTLKAISQLMMIMAIITQV